MNGPLTTAQFGRMDEEQLPVPSHKTHGWQHFAGLYAAEHVAATEFVIGATFVQLGATTMDIIIGLLVGNILAILSWTFITAPIAVETRLSLYTYLQKVAGNVMSKLYNWANVLIFTVISAAMITVSATAVRFAFNVPAQLAWYPTSIWFVAIVLVVGLFAVFVGIYGFNAVSRFSGMCAPWLIAMFISGACVLLPELSLSVLGETLPANWAELIQLGDQSIYTGVNAAGEPGIGLWEVIGYAWAANTITHFGLIDMVLLRYARKASYGLATSTGMLFGHYIAWIGSGIMGAGTAVILGTAISQLDPGDVAFYALGWSGFVIVIVAGWTTAITNLYRAGLAAQAVFPTQTRRRTTIIVGLVMVAVACFPVIYTQILPLLAYAGLLVVPVGAIVFAEHQLFPRIGYTRYWSKFQDYATSTPAIASWAIGLVFGFGMDFFNVMSFFYLFLPTWLLTIGVYTLLAGRAGANRTYPEEERVEVQTQANLRAFQEEQAAATADQVADASVLTKVLRAVGFLALGVTVFLALRTLLASPDATAYQANREVFYQIGFICTLIYFATSVWVTYRSNQLNPTP